MRALVHSFWSNMQLAAMYELGNRSHQAQCAIVCDEFKCPLRHARRAKRCDKNAIADLERRWAWGIAAIPNVLNELLPAVPDACNTAAVKR
jgi:hypothetical protein